MVDGHAVGMSSDKMRRMIAAFRLPGTEIIRMIGGDAYILIKMEAHLGAAG
jgi:hypothetical protein